MQQLQHTDLRRESGVMPHTLQSLRLHITLVVILGVLHVMRSLEVVAQELRDLEARRIRHTSSKPY